MKYGTFKYGTEKYGITIIVEGSGSASPPRHYRYIDERLYKNKEKQKPYNDDEEVLMILKYIVEVIL